MSFENARNMMVENQLRPNKIKDPRILDLFLSIKKEQFLDNKLKNIAYSDDDIKLTPNRGYLKNLHLAQLLQSSDIKKKDKVLHIGALTGYVTNILSKLSNQVIAIENDEFLFQQIKDNIKRLKLYNVEIIKNDFKEGYDDKSPYDLIFIDCPLSNLSSSVLNQLNSDHGRIIMIEKINKYLGKGICITKNKQNFNKEILFDIFSKFLLYKDENIFIF